MSGPARSVVFFQSAAQYEALRASLPEMGEGAVFVGLSPLLSAGLAVLRDGRAFVPYTEMLTAEHFTAAARDAQAASRGWLVTPAGESPPADLAEAVRLEVMQPFHEVLVAQCVISGALERLAPARVVAAPGLDEKVAAVLEYEAQRLGLEVARVEATPGRPTAGGEVPRRASGRHGARRRVAQLLRLLRRAAANAGRLFAFRLKQMADRRPVVLAYGAGVDSINQERLMPAVEANGRVRAVLLRTGETDATMRNRPGGTRFPVLHLVPWNAMLRSGRYEAECRRWAQAFRSWQAGYQGAHPVLFANPGLSPFFDRLYRHLLPHALATGRDARTWLRRLRPSLVLTSNDVSFPVRTLVLEARRRGISTLGLIHSGLNNMHYRDFQSERMAVWGEVHVQDMARVVGKARSSVVPIGNPQYDSLGPGREPEAGGRARRVPRVVVLTAVAQWQMLYYNQAEHLRAWRELERLPEHGIQVTIKPHPRFDDYAFYASLNDPLPDWRDDRPGIAVARDAFLEEVVPTADLAVVPNLPTTGAVEAMLLGKPVIYLMCGFEEVDCCTSIAAGCRVVRKVEEIVPAIREVLESRERQRALVEKGQAYLDDLLGPRDGLATRRLAELVARTARGEPQAGRDQAGPAGGLS